MNTPFLFFRFAFEYPLDVIINSLKKCLKNTSQLYKGNLQDVNYQFADSNSIQLSGINNLAFHLENKQEMVVLQIK